MTSLISPRSSLCLGARWRGSGAEGGCVRMTRAGGWGWWRERRQACGSFPSGLKVPSRLPPHRPRSPHTHLLSNPPTYAISLPAPDAMPGSVLCWRYGPRPALCDAQY